jgi:hypothetical protein
LKDLLPICWDFVVERLSDAEIENLEISGELEMDNRELYYYPLLCRLERPQGWRYYKNYEFWRRSHGSTHEEVRCFQRKQPTTMRFRWQMKPDSDHNSYLTPQAALVIQGMPYSSTFPQYLEAFKQQTYE